MSLGVYYTPNGRMIDGAGLTPDVLEEDPQPVNGVYIDAIRKLTGTVLMKLNSEGIDVYYAEMILKAMGYKIAVPDNLLDADSVAALKSYQKKSDLYADGILGDKTRASLNNDLLKLIYKYDNQYSAAVDLLNQ
jgi:carboxyl-terminal processing protease